MTRLDIHVTASMDDALKQGPARACLRNILRVCVKILEKYAGGKLLISVPEVLQLFGVSSTWNTINVIHNLQSLGIIRNFSKTRYFTDEPRVFGYSTKYSDINYSSSSGSGVDFLSEKRAIWKTLGEAVERYLWSHSDFFKKNQIISSYKENRRNALDIFSLAGFSKEQKKKHAELQFTENTPFAWTPTVSLISDKKILCPVQLVSSSYFRKNVKTPRNKNGAEPMLRWCITTGLATGKNLEDALVSGIMEVVERDAFIITYLNKLSPPIINLEHLAIQNKDINNVLKKFKRYNLAVHLAALPTDFPVHVILAIIRDYSGRGPAVTVGASADFNLKTCLLDALSESLSVRYGIKYSYKNPVNAGRIGRHERLVYWAKHENADKLNFLTTGQKIEIHLDNGAQEKESEYRHNRDQLKILVAEFKKQNQEVCYAELSSKETGRLGFRTVNVIAPELQPMHLDEEIPYFGGKRLKDVPLKLGYKPAVELNKEPHPFP